MPAGTRRGDGRAPRVHADRLPYRRSGGSRPCGRQTARSPRAGRVGEGAPVAHRQHPTARDSSPVHGARGTSPTRPLSRPAPRRSPLHSCRRRATPDDHATIPRHCPTASAPVRGAHANLPRSPSRRCPTRCRPARRSRRRPGTPPPTVERPGRPTGSFPHRQVPSTPRPAPPVSGRSTGPTLRPDPGTWSSTPASEPQPSPMPATPETIVNRPDRPAPAWPDPSTATHQGRSTRRGRRAVRSSPTPVSGHRDRQPSTGRHDSTSARSSRPRVHPLSRCGPPSAPSPAPARATPRWPTPAVRHRPPRAPRPRSRTPPRTRHPPWRTHGHDAP